MRANRREVRKVYFFTKGYVIKNVLTISKLYSKDKLTSLKNLPSHLCLRLRLWVRFFLEPVLSAKFYGDCVLAFLVRTINILC